MKRLLWFTLVLSVAAGATGLSGHRALLVPAVGPDYCWLSFSERKRVTVVPHTGQGPLAIGRPFDVVVTVPSSTVRFVRHFTQYPSNFMVHRPLFCCNLVSP